MSSSSSGWVKSIGGGGRSKSPSRCIKALSTDLVISGVRQRILRAIASSSESITLGAYLEFEAFFEPLEDEEAEAVECTRIST